MADEPIELFASDWIDVNVGAGWADTSGEGTGTLTCFARLADGTDVLLACSHVLFPGFNAPEGLAVYKGSWSSCCCGGPRIGTVLFDPTQAAGEGRDGMKTVDGYIDGKWYGGFWRIPGPAYEYRGGTKPTLNPNGDVFITDCGIARLEGKNITFRNAWRIDKNDPSKDIALKGPPPPDEIGIVPGPFIGLRPDESQYVRVFTPRNGGQLIWGTIAKFPTSAPLSNMIPPSDFQDLLFARGISGANDASDGAKPSARQFFILPRPPPAPKNDDPAIERANYVASYDGVTPLTFDHGDSGAVVINANDEIVGMIIRMMPFDLLASYEATWIADLAAKNIEVTPQLVRHVREFLQVGSFGLATPIETITTHLGITIPPFHSGTITSRGEAITLAPAVETTALEALRVGVERVRRALQTSRRGRVIVARIVRHRREVQRLLTTVRALTAAWRALEGGAYVWHCQQAFRDPGHIVPTSINGVTRETAIPAILDLLARYGSPELRRDLERYRAWAVPAMIAVTRIDDIAELART